MDAWVWTQLAFAPILLLALVAWCRQEGESLWTAAWVAVVLAAGTVALNGWLI